MRYSSFKVVVICCHSLLRICFTLFTFLLSCVGIGWLSQDGLLSFRLPAPHASIQGFVVGLLGFCPSPFKPSRVEIFWSEAWNADQIKKTTCPAWNVPIGNLQQLNLIHLMLSTYLFLCPERCPKKTCPGVGFLGQDCRCYCPGNPVQVCSDDDNSVTKRTTTTTRPTTTRQTKSTTRITTSRPVSSCTDRNARCPYWKSRGECSRNKGFMGYYCKRSCKYCENNGLDGKR